VILDVVETKAFPRLGGGNVVIDISVKNQRDEITMKGTWTVLVASRPASE
jgi:hypothetical protein